ncbi:SGM_5486 family transporter-associated protein [Peterkaempfera griseoplana]|nr:SGM_5486 family transporter-associated protein [Peterkaempfera griseoplana]
MPVLEPNPTDGHKKLLQMAAVIVGIVVVVSVIATIAQKMG